MIGWDGDRAIKGKVGFFPPSPSLEKESIYSLKTLKGRHRNNTYCLLIWYHILQQEVVILHYTSHSLKTDRGSNEPCFSLALEVKHLPQSPLLHLLWTPAIEILPGNCLKNLCRARTKTIQVVPSKMNTKSMLK